MSNVRRMQTPGDERDARLILWIDAYLDENKFAPSVREIGRAFQLKSTSTVQQWLRRLRRQGRIDWVDGETRTLHTVKWEDGEHG